MNAKVKTRAIQAAADLHCDVSLRDLFAIVEAALDSLPLEEAGSASHDGSNWYLTPHTAASGVSGDTCPVYVLLMTRNELMEEEPDDLH